MMVEFKRKGGGPDNMMDHLQGVRLHDRRFIVNVLWELREAEIDPD